MQSLREDHPNDRTAIVTWTLIALNILIYLWDRQWNLMRPEVVFADLAMHPRQITAVLQGEPGDRFPLVTVFTSMFLHANLPHLLGNLLFLYLFGPGVEYALGSPRFALYYLFWGLVAGATHVYVDPTSAIPTLGASGAIGGALGCYFLLFPAQRVEIRIPMFPFPKTSAPVWVLLLIWFLWQILIPQQGVANWAHAGGFLAGMLTVLIMGGRSTILEARGFDEVTSATHS